ncbi:MULTISPECIES: hypothetical protein [Morganellaceae]|nr:MULTISPECIES: hypothetical protein [Morganellaceae]EJD6040565.1 hypothetical protein [Morganella morganii]MEB1123089.1 hypothetical protein [Citrobacter freundii]NPD43157.1 hypothetical protein [Providencia stuartii]WBA59292.1 hypothetical protein O7C57_21245 [Providencia sp. 21OH12SH02B-Prov]EJD6509731.1 hypothetical protein [Providencia rettgeri]
MMKKKTQREFSTARFYFCASVAMFSLMGCVSLEERERVAFELVTNEPNQENIQSYLKLAEELQRKQVDEARQAADAATYERDKELNEYFKQYGRTYKK